MDKKSSLVLKAFFLVRSPFCRLPMMKLAEKKQIRELRMHKTKLKIISTHVYRTCRDLCLICLVSFLCHKASRYLLSLESDLLRPSVREVEYGSSSIPALGRHRCQIIFAIINSECT